RGAILAAVGERPVQRRLPAWKGRGPAPVSCCGVANISTKRTDDRSYRALLRPNAGHQRTRADHTHRSHTTHFARSVGCACLTPSLQQTSFVKAARSPGSRV